MIDINCGIESPLPPAYIIPRPGPAGHVILGGTYFESYSTDPDPNEAERIMRQCYELEPRLATLPLSKGMKDTNDTEGWKGIEVVRHQVGLRPARIGGSRVELESREAGGVIHAFGFGAAG